MRGSYSRIRFEQACWRCILLAAFVVSASSIPRGERSQGYSYGSQYQEMSPSYEQSYSYDAPAYNPSYESYPSYSPQSKAPEYASPSYSYSQEYKEPETPYYAPEYAKEVTPELDTYLAVTFKELNESIHCGILPNTRDEVYQDASIVPFGKYPWVVSIIDDYDNYVCSGTLIQHNFVITAASCLERGQDEYRVRFGDWDLLSDYNEYEPYRNLETRICNVYAISGDRSGSSGSGGYGYSYGYGGGYSQKLVLIQINDIIDFDKLPHVKPLCLPTYPEYGYGQQSYGYGRSKRSYNSPKPSYGYEAPKPSYGYEAPKPSYGYEAPKPSYGYEAPKPSYGYEAPKPSYGYEAPKPSYGYEAPKPSYGYEAPKPSYGYEAPKPSYGYEAPKPSYGYEAPKPSYGYEAPKPSYGYEAPKPSYGYEAPKPSYGYEAPKPSYGYEAPKPSYGYEAPKPSYGYDAPKPSYGYSKPNNYNAECWVVGYYASPVTELKNHPQATAVPEGYSYSYDSNTQVKSVSYDEYYNQKDKSKIPLRAKVKQIDCASMGPSSSSSSGSNSGSYYKAPSYGYGNQASEDMCFVGVDGFDTCVADRGSGVFCVVNDNVDYYSGYPNAASYDYKTYPAYPAYSSGYSYKPSYNYGYDKEVNVGPASSYAPNVRGVLVAVVQEVTQCSVQGQQSAKGSYAYNDAQSRPIRATKVSDDTVAAILDSYWTNSYDRSCRATNPLYSAPKEGYSSGYQEPSYNSYSHSGRAGSDDSSYQSYKASYSVSMSYEPSPSYNAPSYDPPSYESYSSYDSKPYEKAPSYSMKPYEPSYSPSPSYGSYQAPYKASSRYRFGLYHPFSNHKRRSYCKRNRKLNRCRCYCCRSRINRRRCRLRVRNY